MTIVYDKTFISGNLKGIKIPDLKVASVDSLMQFLYFNGRTGKDIFTNDKWIMSNVRKEN